MRRDEEVLSFGHAQIGDRSRCPDPLPVGLQHLSHGRTGDHDTARMQPFGEEVAARVLGVSEVEVGRVVDQSPVGLFGHVGVEAPVARLHVVGGDPLTLGHDEAEGAVGVAEHQEGVRALGVHHLLGTTQDVAQRGAERGHVDVQDVIRWT